MSLNVLSTAVVCFLRLSGSTLLIRKLQYSNREEVVTNLCAVYGERTAKQIIMHE